MEIINPEKLLLKVASILNQLKLDYFITGGFAVSVWGSPRSTLDIDIVVNLFEPQLAKLTGALKKISEAGYIDEGMAEEALRNRGEFNFIDSETGLKVDFWVMKDELFAKSQMQRRVAKKINGQTIHFASPEDLILSKLVWYKEGQSGRQLEDVGSIFKAQEELDFDYLRKWAKLQSTSQVLESLIKKSKDAQEEET